jgi:hypothetical protein
MDTFPSSSGLPSDVGHGAGHALGAVGKGICAGAQATHATAAAAPSKAGIEFVRKVAP